MPTKHLGVVDPTNLKSDEEFVIAQFLRTRDDLQYLERFSRYEITLDRGTSEPISYTFSIAYDLLRRKRKDNREGERFEVVSDSIIGEGGFGEVIKSLGSLTISENDHILYKKKERAIKKQLHENKEADSTSHVKSEYELTKEAPHIHPKPPVFTSTKTQMNSEDIISQTQASYMAMHLLPGKSLNKIIQEAKTGRRRISLMQRLDISINILWAVEKQVHQKNLLHRDLKPENIMIDLKTNNANLVDYHGAKNLTDSNQGIPASGTAMFQPPELFPGSEIADFQSPKTDAYSIGKTLAELWGASFKTGNHIKLRQLANKDTEFNYQHFQDNDLSKTQSSTIKSTLEGLTKSAPYDRTSIMHAIIELELLQTELISKTSHYHALAKKAYDNATSFREDWKKSNGKASRLRTLIKHNLSEDVANNEQTLKLFLKMINIEEINHCNNKQQILSTLKELEDSLKQYQIIAERLLTIYTLQHKNDPEKNRRVELQINTLKKLALKARNFYGTFDEMVGLQKKFRAAMFNFSGTTSQQSPHSIDKILLKITEGVRLYRTSCSMRSIDQLRSIIKYEILDFLSRLRTGKPSSDQTKGILAILGITNQSNLHSSTELSEAIRQLPTSAQGSSMKITLQFHCKDLIRRIFDKVKRFQETHNSPEFTLHANRLTHSPESLRQ